MKIGHTPAPNADGVGLRGNQAAGTPAAGTEATATPVDATRGGSAPEASATVKLSSTAASLLAGASTPEFNAEKVAQVRQAIADGTYKVNADAIADKLIANAQEVLNAQR
jgi:negative regulator of flagellin synthesis FlgM